MNSTIKGVRRSPGMGLAASYVELLETKPVEGEEDVVVTMTLTTEQANVVRDALDFYSRVGMGQFEEFGVVLKHQFDFQINDHDANIYGEPSLWQEVHDHMKRIKRLFGIVGTSLGIGHDKVSIKAKRAYEVYKVLCKTLYDNTSATNVNVVWSDPLTVRVTNDELPNVKITRKR